MDAYYNILLIMVPLIEITYFTSCIIVIIRILRYRKRTSQNSTITLSTLVFVIACIAALIAHNFSNRNDKIGLTVFVTFLIIEITYLLIITLVAIRSNKLKIIFGVLLLSGLVFIPFLATKAWTDITFDPLFAYESLIATSISFAYFIQLGDQIKTTNVLRDPVTLLMLGLFFCYSMPFAYNTTMATISFIDPNFYPSIRNSYQDRLLLIGVSRVGTICYIIFNIFIYKAFKCKTQIQVGISS
jgi:lipid-A-disaccharide synthase-like uncharacterized protein